LIRIGNGLLDRHIGEAGSEAVRVAIASGHGIGNRRWSRGSSCGRSFVSGLPVDFCWDGWCSNDR